MGLFDREDKLVKALEKLIRLYELDLRSRGLTLEEGSEEGEFSYTDETLIERLERDENVRRQAGLPAGTYPHPTRPDGREWGAEDVPRREYLPSLGGISLSFGSGPEGAESSAQNPDPFWYLGGGPPPRVEGYGDKEVKEGKGRPDSPEKPLGGPEVSSSAAGEEA